MQFELLDCLCGAHVSSRVKSASIALDLAPSKKRDCNNKRKVVLHRICFALTILDKQSKSGTAVLFYGRQDGRQAGSGAQ